MNIEYEKQENILAQIWNLWKSNYLLKLKSAHQHQQIDRTSEIKENYRLSHKIQTRTTHMENRCYNPNSFWM